MPNNAQNWPRAMLAYHEKNLFSFSSLSMSMQPLTSGSKEIYEYIQGSPKIRRIQNRSLFMTVKSWIGGFPIISVTLFLICDVNNFQE